MQPQVGHRTAPLLVEPRGKLKGSAVSLGSWAAEHRHDLDEWLHRDGAVLLRGFSIGSPEAFHDVVAAIRPRILNYVGGDSPRKAVGDGIYTSTEFPPSMEIGLHNELSYTRSWPERVFFDTVKAQENLRTGDTPADEALGSHACYGNGSEISIEDLTSVRAACKASERLFTWQADDLLILDNILTMHGRKPFNGDRRVLVAMA